MYIIVQAMFVIHVSRMQFAFAEVTGIIDL